MRFCLPRPQELGQSPFPKADSAVRGKGGGHSASETHKDRQTIGVRTELKTQVPLRVGKATRFQNWTCHHLPQEARPPSLGQARCPSPGAPPSALASPSSPVSLVHSSTFPTDSHPSHCPLCHPHYSAKGRHWLLTLLPD